MTFKTQFIQTSGSFTGEDSYTILETKKVKEIRKAHFASVITARHNGKNEKEEFK